MFWHKVEKGPDCPSTDGQRLVEECEAFLAGRWVTVLEAHGQPVPSLAWLNLLAHGSLGDITAASRWCPSRSVFDMFSQILGVARNKTALRELQWVVLVPLELELLRSKDAASLDTQTVLSSVVEAVDCFRHGSQR